MFLNIIFMLGISAEVVTAEPTTITVFSRNFDGSLPAEISPGAATLTGVQGYAGYGPSGNQFGGNFLRSATSNIVTLTLNDLPTHDTRFCFYRGHSYEI